MVKEKKKDDMSTRPSTKRIMQCRFERERGKRRYHRQFPEKFRKYETRAQGYEFIPALMHLLRRYISQIPEHKLTDLDREMASALDEIPEARDIVERAVRAHFELPYNIKRRVFSPKYLNLAPEVQIDKEQMKNIILRAVRLKNQPVRYLLRRQLHIESSVNRKEQCCCCCCCCCPNGEEQGPNQTHPPNKYEVTFSHLYCVDESDPEWWGHDEPYVVFGVITEEMAETGVPAWGFHTPVYEGVDDGDRRPSSGDEDLRLYGYTGPMPIDSSILITATCIEHDLGDVTDITNTIRTALTASAKAGVSAGGVAGWIVAGVSIVGIGVTYLVDLIGSDDQIGETIAMTLTEAEADEKTASVNPYYFPPLHFDGGDDDGIYDVYLKLRRA